MNKRILAWLLILSMCIHLPAAFADGGAAALSADFILSASVCDTAPEGYTGVSTPEDFRNMLSAPDGEYILLSDIDLGVWQPDGQEVFTGVLNGNGHTISYRTDGKVENDRDLVRGLFYALDGAFISNLRVRLIIRDPSDDLDSANIALGGLAAYGRGALLLYNCVVDAQIDLTSVEWNEEFSEFSPFETVKIDSLESKSANSGAGGMIGIADSGSTLTLEYCRVKGNIGSAHNVGGFIGMMSGDYCDLMGCENLADLTGISNVGGIIGNAPNTTQGYASVSCSANCGEIFALSNFAGGIVGSSNGGNFDISDCANTGLVVAGIPTGKGYAGGLAGRYSGTMLRCVNTGQVLSVDNASLYPTHSKVTTDDNSLYCLDNGWNEMQTPEGILMTMEELQSECVALDDLYVWTTHPTMKIPYPRPLLGERFDYFRAGYVQNMKNLCVRAGALSNYIQVNVAGTLGEEYRKAGLNEVNNVWRTIEIIESVLNYDLKAIDEFSNYDMLLCDLMLQTSFFQTYQAMCNTGSMEQYTWFMDYFAGDDSADAEITDIVGGSLEKANHIAKNIMPAIPTDAICRQLFEARVRTANSTNSLGIVVNDLAGQLLDEYNDLHFLNKNAGTLFDGIGQSAQIIGIGYSTLDTYFEGARKGAIEDMAEQIYLNSYGRFGELLNRLAYTPTVPATDYPEPVNAQENIELLQNALEDLRKNAFSSKNVNNSFQTLADTTTNAAFAALIPMGAVVEWFLTETLDGAKPFGVMFTYGMSKLGLSIGVLLGDEMLGLKDVTYYGALVNSAGYMADRLQPLVQAEFDDFRATGLYEDAVELADAVGLYLNLQILACDYALKYSKATGFRCQDDRLAEEQLRLRRTDLVVLLDQMTNIVT